jgi:hypothetical protein
MNRYVLQSAIYTHYTHYTPCMHCRYVLQSAIFFTMALLVTVFSKIG